MKIILSAYFCHPDKGSESGVGWNWLVELAKRNQILIYYYKEQNQDEDLRKALASFAFQKNIELVPVSVPKFFQDHFFRIRYEIWQWRVYKATKSLNKHFDLIHHITIATWWNCGHLWKTNIPFIFGPISGAQTIPFSCYPFLRFRDKLNELARLLMLTIGWYFWPRYRRSVKAASFIFAANSETYNNILKISEHKKSYLFSEVGTNTIDLDELVRKEKKVINLIWVSNFYPRKNLSLVIQALALIDKSICYNLDVIGDGPLKDFWQKEVNRCFLQDRVCFTGYIERNKLALKYKNADLFLFSSLREATGTVIMEALSFGLPIIGLNLHGLKDICDDRNAILINTTTKKQMIEDYAKAIFDLANDYNRRQRMGLASLQIANNNTWEKRGSKMQEFYNTIKP